LHWTGAVRRTEMRRSYLSGYRTALQRWPLALLLFAATSVPGLLFSATAWLWLADALGKSLATRTLLTDLDMNVFVDLLGHHHESLRALLLGGLLLAVLCWLFSVWLNAITIAVVGDDLPLAAAAHRGLDLYATFLGLDLVTLVADGLLLMATVGVGRWLTHWTADSPSEITVYLFVGGSALVAGALLLVFTATHDHARIHSAATGTGAAGAYVWAFRFVIARERRALPLLGVLLLTGGVGWGAYQTLGRLLATTSTTGVIGSLLWGELLMLCRMFLRVWSFAAQTELQNLSELTAG
jgi:hypothetical protein